MPSVLVGPDKPVKTLADALKKAKIGDNILLIPGKHEVKQTLFIHINKLTIGSIDPKKPAELVGAIPSKPGVMYPIFEDHGVGTHILDFLCSGKASNNLADLQGSDAIVENIKLADMFGGCVNSHGSVNSIVRNAHALGRVARNFNYVGGPKETINFRLENASAVYGGAQEPLLRYHNYDGVTLINVKVKEVKTDKYPNSTKPVLRVHQGVRFSSKDSYYDGLIDLGPMGDEQGGINDTGDVRKEKMAYRTKQAQFIGGELAGSIILESGLENCLFQDLTLRGWKTGYLFGGDLWKPYGERPMPSIQMVNVIATYKGGQFITNKKIVTKADKVTWEGKAWKQ